MNYPVPDYSRFAPITADLNHLYKKHRVLVYPRTPVTQGSMGGQRIVFGDPYPLVCNVQFGQLPEHDQPVKFTNRAGRLYTAEYGKLSQYDEFVHEGIRYKIDGVENYKDNIAFRPHHTEAIFSQTESGVPRA